jgi:dTDP-glucose pyrophosphorylase
MLNILIPLGGKSKFFDKEKYLYPEALIEVLDKTMIEWVIDNYQIIKEETHFIFVLKEEDCTKYHLDNSLRLLTNNDCTIVKLKKETKGSACSALLAIEYINNNDRLIIANGNQLIELDFNKVLEQFDKEDRDAGLICFESVHPKWSYARLDDGDYVVETAEKRPISKNAIAGFYYFRCGQDFVSAAMKSIKRDANVDGAYYIAPTLNEMVLENRNIGIYSIGKEQYHSFYSPQKIEEYERKQK